jgi:hypothetical protein
VAQCPGPDGLCEHYASGRSVPRGERHPGGVRPCQDQEYILSAKIIPFKLKGEITALHSFKRKKPHRTIGNAPVL